jgi:hypothetical protein
MLVTGLRRAAVALIGTTAIIGAGLTAGITGAAAAAHTAPANDNFGQATLVGPAGGGQSFSTTVMGNNTGATQEDDEPCLYQCDGGGASVWYYVSTPGPGKLVITGNKTGTGFDAQLGVFEPTGSPAMLDNLSEPSQTVNDVNAARFGTFGAGLEPGPITIYTDANTNFYIDVDGIDSGSGAPTGAFSFSAAFTPAPANDELINATVVSGTSASTSGTTVAATTGPDEPPVFTDTNDYGGHSVWYSYTPAATGLTTVTVTGSSGYNPAIGIYTDGDDPVDYDGLNDIVDDASATNGNSHVSSFTTSTVADTTYYVQVDGQGTQGLAAQSGTFNFGLSEVVAPSNDNFAQATTISGASGTKTGTNVGATVESNEDEFPGEFDGNPSGETVWYKWTPTTSGTYSFDTLSSSTTFNTELAVYTGHSLSTLDEVAQNDDYSAATIKSRLVFQATGGTPYYIQIDGDDDGTDAHDGTFVLSWGQPPGNDDFANATSVSGLSGSTTGTNVDASEEDGEGEHGNAAGGASVWWVWQAPANGQFEFDTHGSSFDTTMSVVTGDDVDDTASVGENNDVSGSDTTSKVSFSATGGTTYYIAVDGDDGAEGSVDLNWSPLPPTNDAFSSAQSLAAASSTAATVQGSNVGATAESGEPAIAGHAATHTVWYKIVANGNSQIEFDTENSTFDTELGVFTGTAVGSLTPVVSNDDISGSDTKSRVSFAATSGVTYYIAVDGKSGATGSIALNDEVPPPDTTKPVVSSLAPADGATVSGTVSVTATATDNVAVASVAISVDGNPVATLTSAPYTYSLDTTALADGSHTVSAVATDTSSNTSTAVTHTVTVRNTDTSAITIAATAKVAAGKATRITGVLTDSSTSTPLGGVTVALFARSNVTGSTFAQVGTTISTSTGSVTLSPKPSVNTVYEWRYLGSSGTPKHAAATSATKTVTVTQVVTAAFSPAKIKHGKSAKLYGTLLPTASGQSVVVQQLIGGKWKATKLKAKVKVQKLPNGKKANGYVIVVKEKKKGTYTFRASAAATKTVAAGVSGSAKLKVT